jgi:hypothetical protein
MKRHSRNFSNEIEKIEKQTFNTFSFNNKLPVIDNVIFKHKDNIHTQAFLLNYFKLPTIKDKQKYYIHQNASKKKILNNNSNNIRTSIKSINTINSNLSETLKKLCSRKSSVMFLDKTNSKSRNINVELNNKDKIKEENFENSYSPLETEEKDENNKITPLNTINKHVPSYSLDLSTNNKTIEAIPRIISAVHSNKSSTNQKNEIKGFELHLDKIKNYSKNYYNKITKNILNSDRYEKRMIKKSKKKLKNFNKKNFVDTNEYIKELESNKLTQNIKINKFFDKLISEKKHFDLIVLRNMLNELKNSTKNKKRIYHKEELEKKDKQFFFYIENSEMLANRIYKTLDTEK